MQFFREQSKKSIKLVESYFLKQVTRKDKLQWNVTKADIIHGDFTHDQFNFSDNFYVVHCYGASIVILNIKFSPCIFARIGFNRFRKV